MARLNLELEPLTGAEIDTFTNDAYAAPKALVDQVSSLVFPPGSK